MDGNMAHTGEHILRILCLSSIRSLISDDRRCNFTVDVNLFPKTPRLFLVENSEQ